MNFHRLRENELAEFLENIKNRLSDNLLSAIDPTLRAQLLAEIGTIPEDLAAQSAGASDAEAKRMTAVSMRDTTTMRARRAASRVRDALKVSQAPAEQYSLCAFDYNTHRAGFYVAQDPTELSAVGYSNGVNRLVFSGNNKRSLVVYEIWRRDSRAAPWAYLSNTKKQSFADQPVAPGQFYEYKVRAVAAKRSSNFSNAAIVYENP